MGEINFPALHGSHVVSPFILCFAVTLRHNSGHHGALILKQHIRARWWWLVQKDGESIEEHGDDFASHTYIFKRKRTSGLHDKIKLALTREILQEQKLITLYQRPIGHYRSML